MTRAKFEATHSSIKGPKKAFNQGYHKFESVWFEVGPKSEGVKSGSRGVGSLEMCGPPVRIGSVPSKQIADSALASLSEVLLDCLLEPNPKPHKPPATLNCCPRILGGWSGAAGTQDGHTRNKTLQQVSMRLNLDTSSNLDTSRHTSTKKRPGHFLPWMFSATMAGS